MLAHRHGVKKVTFHSGNSRNPLFEHLGAIKNLCLNSDPTLKDIFEVFGPDGHYVLILFLTLPFLQPIPLPGLSIPFGLLIAIEGIFGFFEKPTFVPDRWARLKLSSYSVLKIAGASETVFAKLTPVLHSRLIFLTRGPFRTFNMILLVFNAILLAIPLLIPFTNGLPALVVFLQILGILEEDGIFILLSYFQAIVCIGYFYLIAIGAEVALVSLWRWH